MILVLIAGYPASTGPAVYGVAMGWLPRETMLLFEPARFVAMRSPLRSAWIRYWRAWDAAAIEKSKREGGMTRSHGWEYDLLELE